MKEAIFHLKRDTFGQDAKKRETTLGYMLDPCQDHFCFMLEDVVRGFGIKSKKYTAIPATEGDFTYKLRVMKSPKYGNVVTVFTHMEGDVPVLEYGGIRFGWIRSHGGNDADDTEGCLLANKNRDTTNMSAWGSMLKDFAKEVQTLTDQGFDVRLRITNLPQES